MTDDARYTAAVKTFLLEPEALTQEQIDVLTHVDDLLGTRAAENRSAALTKAAEARHRAALGQPPVLRKRSDPDAIADDLLDVITLQLAKPRSRIKALEASNAALEQRCLTLEGRLLELEAQAASRTVPHVHEQ